MAVCTTSSAQPLTGGRSSDTRHPARPSRAARFTESANSTGHFIVLPTQNFTLVVEPSTATAIAGTSVNLKVSTVTTGGYTGLTTLSTASLPIGVTGTFTPPNLGPNASGILTLSTSGSTPSSNAGRNAGRCIRTSLCGTLPLAMPRQPRLDAPETLHHVMVRGIERRALFRDVMGDVV